MLKCLLAPAGSGAAAISEASGFCKLILRLWWWKPCSSQYGVRGLFAGEQGSAFAGCDVDNGYSAFGVCPDAIVRSSYLETSFWLG